MKRAKNNFYPRKIQSFIILSVFLANQIVPPALASQISERELPSVQTVLPVQDAQPVKEVVDLSFVSKASAIDPTTQFLQQELVLEKTTDSDPAEEEESSTEENDSAEQNMSVDLLQEPDEPTGLEAFKKAVDQLFAQTTQIAVSVVEGIKKVTVDQLTYLVSRAIEKAVEVGVAVIKGVVTLFTSFDANGWMVNETIKNELNGGNTQVLGHIQSKGQKDPSLVDIAGAEERGKDEYVLSLDENNQLTTVRYNGQGILSSDAVQDFVDQINYVLDPVQEKINEVKEWASQALLDLSKVLYRSDPPTVFPARPVLSSFATTSPAGTVSIQQSSGSQFRTNYNVSNAGSGVGSSIEWESPANLNSTASFIFNMRTDSNCASVNGNCVKVEFVDSTSNCNGGNCVAAVLIQGLTSSFQEVGIPKSTLQGVNPSLDFTKIKRINFVIGFNEINPVPANGFLEIQTGGLDFIQLVNGVNFDANVHTNFSSLRPTVSGLGGRIGTTAGEFDGVATINQVNGNEFNFGYEVNGAPTAFAVGSVSFGTNGVDLTSLLTNGTDLVLGLNGPNNAKTRIEVKTKGPNNTTVTAKFDAVLIGSLKNYIFSLAGGVLPAGFDLTKVLEINVVMDRTHINFTGNSNTLNVRIKGTDLIPNVAGVNFDANVHTNFSSLRPTVSGLGGRIGTTAGEFDGVATINQVNGNEFNFGYEVNGAPTAFAVGSVSFGTNGVDLTSLLTNGTDLVLGLNGPNNAKTRIEVKTKGPNNTTVTAKFDAVLIGSLKNYIFSLAGGVLPAGFDLTKVLEINVVMDRTHINFTGNSNTLNVRIKGTDLIPNVAGVNFDANVHTNFSSLRPTVSGLGGRIGTTAGEFDGVATINQVNGNEFNFGYEVNGAPTAFAVGSVSFGTNGVDLTSLLTNGTDLVLGLNGPNNAKTRIEVKTKGPNNTTVTAKFDAVLIGSLKNYIFSLAGGVLPAGFDLTKVLEINVVMDRTHINFTGNSNTLNVRIKGTDLIPNVAGVNFDANVHTNFSSLRPTVSGLGGRIGTTAGEFDGVATINQVNGNEFNFGYEVNGAPTAFAVGSVSFGTNGVDLTSLLTNGTDLVLGLNGPNNAKTRIEVKTKGPNNTTVTAKFDAVLIGSLKNYIFSLAGGVLPAGFDLTKVLEINVVMDRTHINFTGNSNTLNVRIKGTDLIPNVAGVNFDANVHTNFSSLRPTVSGLGGRIGTTAGEFDGVATINQVNGNEFNFGYEVNGAPTAFAVGSVSFGTNGVDLTSLLTNGTDLVLGLNGPNNAKTRIEVKTKGPNNTTVTAKFDAVLIGSLKNYIFSLAGGVLPAGFDLTKVLEINVVMDRTHINFTGNSNTLNVRIKGTDLIPNVAGVNFDANVHTNFSSLRPTVSGLGGRIGTTAGEFDGVATINQVNGNEFNFGYEVNGAPTAFAVGSVSFGTNGVDLTSLLTNGTDLVLGLNGPNNAKTRIEVKTKGPNNTTVTAKFDAVLIGSLKNYIFSLAGGVLPAGFDLTKVLEINVVMDRTHINFTGNSNTLNVRIKGTDLIPNVAGVNFDANVHTNFSSLRPTVSGLGGRIGTTAGEFDGVATINQVNGNEFNFGYEVNGAPTAFAVGSVSFGTNGVDLTSLLTNGTDLVLGLNGPNNAKTRIEVKTKGPNNTTVTAKFDAVLIGSLKNYIFSLAGGVLPAGFDLTKVLEINVVMDRTHINFTGNSNTLNVRIKGTDLIPNVAGVNFDANVHTNFSSLRPTVSGLGGRIGTTAGEFDGVATINQVNGNEFNFGYEVNGAPTAFAVGSVSFGTNGVDLTSLLTNGTDLVLGLNGPNNAKTRIEVKTKGPNNTTVTAKFDAVLIGSLKNYIFSLAGGVLPAGFDLTKVLEINVVMDRTHINFTGNSNTLNVRIKGTDLIPNVAGVNFDANVHTNFSSLRPTVSGLGGRIGTTAGEFDGVATINQVNGNEFNFGYEVNGAPTAFAVGSVSFGTNGVDLTSLLTNGTDLVLGLNGPNNAKTRIEVKTKGPNNTTVTAKFDAVLIGSLKNYIFSLAGGVLPAGFDLTKVLEINVVMDRTHINFTGNSNTLNVRIKGTDLIPNVAGVNFDANVHTNFSSLRPTVSGLGGRIGTTAGEFDGVATINQVNGNEFNFGYEVNGAPTAFAVGSVSFGTNGVDLTSLLTNGTDLVLGLNGPNNAKTRIEVKTKGPNNTTVTAKFDAVLIGSLKNYIFSLAGGVLPAGFDLTKVLEINVVMDRTHINFTGNSNTLNVRIKGTDLIPNVAGVNFDANVHTNFSSLRPTVSGLGGRIGTTAGEFDGVATINQVNGNEFNFGYEVNGAPTAFAVGSVSFGTNGVDLTSLLTNGTDLVLGLNGPNNAKTRIEVKTKGPNNTTVTAKFDAVLIGSLKNYIFSLAGGVLPAGFDLTKVLEINVVMDRTHINFTGNSNTLNVRIKGTDLIPNVAGVNFDANVHTNFSSLRPTVSGLGGRIGTTAGEFDGVATINQVNGNEFNFGYEVNGAPTAFAVGSVSFGTNGVDLTSLLTNGTDLVLGLNGPNNAKTRIEVKTKGPNNTTVTAKFDAVLIGSLKNYIFSLAGGVLPAGFDLTKVLEINVVMDRTHINFTGNSNTLNVRIKGTDLIPNVAGVNFDANVHTNFSSLRPTVSGLGGRIGTTAGEFDGVATINQVNGNEFNFGYEVNGAPTAFAVGSVSFGTNGVDLTSLLTNGTDLVLGLNGPNNAKTRIEVKTKGPNNTTVTAKFDAVLIGSLKNYIFSLAGGVLPAGFDLTKVLEINVVMDRTHINFTGNSNTLNVRIKGTDLIPNVAGVNFDANVHTNFSSLRPTVSGLGGRIGTTAGEFDGVATINQVNGNEFNFGYEVNGAPTAFAVGSVSFGTNGVDLTSLLTNGTDLVLGLNGPNNAKTRIEVKTKGPNNTTVTAKFDAVLIGSLKNYIFSLAGGVLPAGFDLTKVLEINVVMDRTHINFTGNSNTLNVRIKGTDLIPNVAGVNFDANVHTNFSSLRPTVSGLGGRIGTTAGEFDGVATINQVNGNEFNFGYEVNGAPTAFAVGSVSFGTNGVDLTSLLTNGTDLVLGLNGPNNAKTRIEVKTKGPNNTTVTAKFDAVLIGSLKNYIFSLAGGVLPAGFDLTKVLEINVVMDRTHINFTGNSNTLNVRIKGTDLIPNVAGVNFDANVHTNFSSLRPTVSGLGGRIGTTAGEFDGVATINQVNGNEFNFGYEVNGAPTAFAVGSVSFGTNGVDLTSLLTNGTDLVLGLNGPNNAKTRIEVKTKGPNNTTVTAKFDAVLIGSLKNYIFSLAGGVLPAGFDLTKVLEINVVMDRTHINFTGNSNTLNVRIRGLVPILNGTPLNESLITTVPNTPNLTTSVGNSVNGQPNAQITLNQLSSGEFEYIYDLSPSVTSFSTVTMSKGGFDQNNIFQGTPLALPQDVIFALRGHEGSRVRVFFEDINHRIANFILNLRPIYQNFTFSFINDNIPTGFDRNNIAQIVFVEDQGLSNGAFTELVKVKAKGLSFTPTIVPSALQAVKDSLTQESVSYFQVGVGLDPATHFPYDSVNSIGQVATFTQPTLIGFYLQILGDVVRGKTNNGMTVDQALAEIDTLMTNLLSAQTNFGWNGLLPWLELSPNVHAFSTTIGLGDNANLAQSLAVMVGSIESSTLTASQQTAANTLISKVDQFANNQAPGYAAFVDNATGLLRGEVNSSNGQFQHFMNRLANEFRGAIAFLKVRYNLPNSVWTGLVRTIRNYTDRNNTVMSNLAPPDGGAFQAFWPLLKNDERDFIGFRNALYNHMVTQMDYAFQYRIPGFLSASQRPGNGYFPRVGIPQMAEFPNDMLVDLGSTYALASALSVDPFSVLTWLNAIEDQLPGLNGPRGFFDSARSNSEIATLFLGIDVASTALGLSDTGSETFETYLRNRGLELSYNLLYDSISPLIGIVKTSATLASPPEFPDRSLAVFGNLSGEEAVDNFPINNTAVTGVRFNYGILVGGTGGQKWTLNQTYNAQANQLVLIYNVTDSPQSIKIQLFDANNQELFATTQNLVNSTTDQRLAINLPNQTKLSVVKKIAVTIVNQGQTGDLSGDFFIRAIDFQHLGSSQNLLPDANLTTSDITTVPGTPPAQLTSSLPTSTLQRLTATETRLNYDLSQPNTFAGISVNFNHSGGSADLSGINRIVFGLNSNKIKTVKIEIDDASGNRAILVVQNVDVTRNYYQFLTSSLAGSVNLQQITRINFIVDTSITNPGEEVGILDMEIGGLQFP